MTSARRPESVRLRKASRLLEVSYADGRRHQLPIEYLRVFSPSAEVRGHGREEPMLVPGKRDVEVLRVEPVGQYALRLVFSDGHDSGLYSWEVLEELGQQRAENWARYLQRLSDLGLSRDSEVVTLAALPKKYTPPSP